MDKPSDRETAPCRVCDCETTNRFNMALKPVAICEICALLITAQQVIWMTNTERDNGG